MPRLTQTTSTSYLKDKDPLLATWTTYNMVSSVAASLDGTLVASGTFGGAVSIWDIENKHVVAGPLKGHTATVNSVAFSPNGRHVVSGSDDCAIRLWDTQTGALVAGPLRGHRCSVSSVAFSFDGARLASGSSDRTICIWDLKTYTVVSRSSKWHKSVISSLAFSPDGAYVVSGSKDGRVSLWHLRDQIIAGPRADHPGRVFSVAFSPKHKLIAFGSSDHKIHILRVQGESLDTVARLEGHTDSVLSVTFSLCGTHIISGSADHTIRVWDVRKRACVAGPFKAHTNWVSSVAAGLSGTRFISGSHDRTIRIWDIQPKDHIIGPTFNKCLDETISPIPTSRKTPPPADLLLDVEDWSPKSWAIDARVNSVSISPDGTRVVSGSDDHFVRMWNIETGNNDRGQISGHKDLVLSVAFSPDGLFIASGSADRTVYIWNAHNRRALIGPLEGHKGFVYSVAFSPDSTKLISSSGDRTIRVWDVQSGRLLSTLLGGHSDWVRSASFSPDGARIVSSSIDHTLRIWDANTYQLIGGPLRCHTNWIRSVAFSPDSARIVSGSDDTTLCLWDAHSGKLLQEPLIGHTSRVNSVAFSRNGYFIASGSQDGTIIIWHAQHGKKAAGPVQAHNSSVLSVIFSPDSTQVVSGSSDNTIRRWNIVRRDLVEKPFSSFPDQIVTSEMEVDRMFRYLLDNRCVDLTSRIKITQPDVSAARGTYSDIYHGILDNKDEIAIKFLRPGMINDTGRGDYERAMREAYIWSKMKHKNVQQLLGIVLFPGRLGMVSPWMNNGNLQEYIKVKPRVDRYKLCLDVATGVAYLHNIKMVHGDIKALNVLVSQDEVAKLSDFDHSILSDYTPFPAAPNTGGGTLRWTAPELRPMPPDEDSSSAVRSQEADIYALGMTMLEIITGRVPYSELKTDKSVSFAIDNSTKPVRPQELLGPNRREHEMWDLLVKCWDRSPKNRPNAAATLKMLQRLVIGKIPAGNLPNSA